MSEKSTSEMFRNFIDSDLSAEEQKEKTWLQKRVEIDQLADAVGKGIEPKVKEMIVGLNLLGYETTQSCEGHSGPEQFSLPWVRIAAPGEPAIRFVGQEQAIQKAAVKFNATTEEIKRADNMEGYWEAMGEASQNGETPEYLSWREQNAEIMSKLQALLEQFYIGRDVEPGMKFRMVESGEGDFELRMSEEELAALPEDLTAKNKEDIAKQLPVCQSEIGAITKFLKEKYLSN